MKKKLIATLVASAVLSTGIIGLTACGGGNGGHDINKGEEVSKAGWAAAITATQSAKNYTADAYQEVDTTMTGNMGELTNINLTGKTIGEAKFTYDLDNGGIYVKQTVKITVSGVPDELKGEDGYKDDEYVTESYCVKEGDTYYTANYRGNAENPEWSTGSTTSFSSGGLGYLFNSTYSVEEDGTAVTLSELYDAFTYSNGVYTATLWGGGSEETVSLSFKGGYVVGYSFASTHEEGDEDSKMINSGKMIYNFSNYGSTTISPSDDAKKAVEDYKAKK